MTTYSTTPLFEDAGMPACAVPGCGHMKGRGRPKKGWVRVEGDFPDDTREPRWFCSWRCVFKVAEIQMQKEPA